MTLLAAAKGREKFDESLPHALRTVSNHHEEADLIATELCDPDGDGGGL